MATKSMKAETWRDLKKYFLSLSLFDFSFSSSHPVDCNVMWDDDEGRGFANFLHPSSSSLVYWFISSADLSMIEARHTQKDCSRRSNGNGNGVGRVGPANCISIIITISDRWRSLIMLECWQERSRQWLAACPPGSTTTTTATTFASTKEHQPSNIISRSKSAGWLAGWLATNPIFSSIKIPKMPTSVYIYWCMYSKFSLVWFFDHVHASWSSPPPSSIYLVSDKFVCNAKSSADRERGDYIPQYKPPWPHQLQQHPCFVELNDRDLND